MDVSIKDKDKASVEGSGSTGITKKTCEKMVVNTSCSEDSGADQVRHESELRKLELTSLDSVVMGLPPDKDSVYSGTNVDEDNTQMLTDNMTSEALITTKEVETDCIIDKPNKSPDAEKLSAVEEKHCTHVSFDSVIVSENDSSNLEDTVVIESDEEMKKGEKSCGERSSGNVSLASTVELKSSDLKPPASPQDLFASQLEEEGSLQNSNDNERSGNMDFEDFIPPSQSDVRCGSPKLESSENLLSLVRKRKREDDSQILTDRKIPRVQDPCHESNSAASSSSSPSNHEQTNKQSQESPEGTSKSERKEREEIGTEASKDQKMQSSERDSSAKSVQTSRKSVEIVFTSLSGSSDKETSQCGQELLPSIPEENGDDLNNTLNDSQDLVLRLSVSPSQIAVLEEVDEQKNSGGGSQSSNSSSLLGKSTCQKSSASLNNSSSSSGASKPNSVWNSYSSNDAKFSEIVTVDEGNDDMEVLTVEKQSSVMNTTVGECHENGTARLDPVGADDSVVIDDEEKSCSSSVNHKDMNGTHPKRKRSVEEGDGNHENTQEVVQMAESDSRKRSRLLKTNAEDDRNTPDIIPLPTKESPAASFTETDLVVRLYCCIRVQVPDQSKHVSAIEIKKCGEIDSASLGKNSCNVELSPGNLADTSERSKNSSPSSVTSLGPFQLKPPSWRLSTSSSSTTSSGHSITEIKSKSSSDWSFPAPSRPAPYSRSIRERQKNLTFSQEFARELFEVVEKNLYADEIESKAPSVPLEFPVSVESIADNSSATLAAAGNDTEPKKDESQEVAGRGPETPRSTKKSRGGRARNISRNAGIKAIKEVKEEEAEKEEEDQRDAVTPSSAQRKGRKTPVRSSKRTISNSSAGGEDHKGNNVSTGRGRRNRSDTCEKSETNSQEASQHTYEWDSEGCFSKLMPEAPVFARWTDKKYYSGKIKEKAKDGRWVIHFDDNNVKALKDEFIIPINILLKGQIVFAEDDEGYEQGIIIEFKMRSGEVLYGVEMDSGRKVFVPRSRVFMSEDQARLLQENMDPKSPTTSSPAITTVTCENIVQHKRPRSTRVLFGNVESPGVSGVAKTPKRSGKSDLTHDTSCSSSVSDSNDKGPSMLEELCGVDPEAPSSLAELLPAPSGRGKGPGRIKSKSRTPRKNTAPNHSVSDTEDHRKVIEKLGPIPEKGSNLFSSYCFLLTYAGVKSATASKKDELPTPTTISSEYGSTDEGIVFSNFPFVKEHIKKQIEAGGGKVYENFEDVPESQYPNCFLVSDRPSLTAKYILCLANGIKIIPHDWVILHCKGQTDCRHVRMDAGWDLEERCYVSAETAMRTRKQKQKPLSGKEVGLVNDSQAFNKFWGRVLELLGATVRLIAPEQDREFSGVHVIVTDSSCSPEVQDRACEWGIPLVSPVWISQSLITWRARPYDGHPHYRYDFCTSD